MPKTKKILTCKHLYLGEKNILQECNILPARRCGEMRHRIGERYETLHQLPGQKHGASGHGGHHLDHLAFKTNNTQQLT